MTTSVDRPLVGTTVSVVSDAEIVERWLRGERAADIARAFGLSRQRVDQRLKRNGLAGLNRNGLPAPEVLLGAASGAPAMYLLARALGKPQRTIELALERHGLLETVRGMIRANRAAHQLAARRDERRLYARRLREIAEIVGHTPTIAELKTYKVFHARLAQVFGSTPNAMHAAGLSPNLPGVPPSPLPPDFVPAATPLPSENELAAR